MGVSHSMNKAQVDEVLTEFEATTDAIKGIEHKISRVQGYVKTAEEQRENMSRQAEDATGLIDNMTASMNTKTEDLLDYFTETLDFFADLMESLENTIGDLQLMNAPRELQKELGPLLVPAVVLVMIITVSNCVFGFLLAANEEATGKITLSMLLGSVDDDEVTGEGMNILKVFAIFHVILIAIAVVYLVFEGGRRHVASLRRRRALKQALKREQEQRLVEEMRARILAEEESEEEEEQQSPDDELSDMAEDDAWAHDPVGFPAVDMAESKPVTQVGERPRINKQLAASTGDSSPPSTAVSPMSNHRSVVRNQLEPMHIPRSLGTAATEDGEQPDFDFSPQLRGSGQEGEELASPGSDRTSPKKMMTPPRALEQLQLPSRALGGIFRGTDPRKNGVLMEHDGQHAGAVGMTEDSTDPSPDFSSRDSTPSRRGSPMSPNSAKNLRRSSSNNSNEEADFKPAGSSSVRHGPKGKRRTANSIASGGSATSPQKRMSLFLEPSKVPKIQISSVLRKVQQKTMQAATERGAIPARSREGPLQTVDEESSQTGAGLGVASPESSVSPHSRSSRSQSPALARRMNDFSLSFERKLQEISSRRASTRQEGLRNERFSDLAAPHHRKVNQERSSAEQMRI